MFRQSLVRQYGDNRNNPTLIYDYNTGRSTPGMRQAFMGMQNPRGAARQRWGHGGWF
ncbi:hypothetical protein Slin15195_G110100 [Septoria linicola]|uniref:Uncharacterized protein n=1 Tax=Septoria linicola TaxID=215465 RepID=A0A9Q9END6_9PEZI|nr:hypothetical protein Slin14017_G108450 [Septoria linicola]USW57691.1 hypothetical protein Slin15195_G110100 [Septoria linicola]